MEYLLFSSFSHSIEKAAIVQCQTATRETESSGFGVQSSEKGTASEAPPLKGRGFPVRVFSRICQPNKNLNGKGLSV